MNLMKDDLLIKCLADVYRETSNDYHKKLSDTDQSGEHRPASEASAVDGSG